MEPKILRLEPTTLHFVKNEDMIGLTIDGRGVATNRVGDSAYLVKIFSKIDAEEFPPGTRVAHLGGGMGWLAKMLIGYGLFQRIFEKDADICAFLDSGILHNHADFIVGNWQQTLESNFDIIIYDIDAPLSIEELKIIKNHLSPNGKLYTLTD